jgi:hypothetical protein
LLDNIAIFEGGNQFKLSCNYTVEGAEKLVLPGNLKVVGGALRSLDHSERSRWRPDGERGLLARERSLDSMLPFLVDKFTNIGLLTLVKLEA